ncbi:hypothetical protein D3C72_2023270 [compost metagenome]
MVRQFLVHPVVDLRQVHPLGARHIGRRPRMAALGQHLIGDVRDLERHPAGRPHHDEHLAADLVGVVVVAERMVQRRPRQRQANLADPRPVHQAPAPMVTPTPIGQTTPVPPMPQYPAGFLAR